MPKLYYQGHGSFRLISDKSIVIYVDPFAGDGYNRNADLILITHHHNDHCHPELVPKKSGCKIITDREAIKEGVYGSFRVRGVRVRALPATNEYHDPRECVGYLITMDGLKIYAAGDTSETDAMSELILQRLDYCLLPVDGTQNMNPISASICAARIGARHSIPIHTKYGSLFDEGIARQFDVPGRLIVRPGQEIEL